MNQVGGGADERAATIKQLADAVSMQARVANRIWLATIAASLLVVLPRSTSPGSSATDIALPFQLGDVAPTAFYPVAFAMLSVLVVAFASAHAQQARANDLAQRALDRLATAAGASLPPISIRELFDMFRMPSANRVAPLAQLMRGPYQFHDQAADCPPWLRVASSVYYLTLKLVASGVYYGLPALGIWYAFERTISIDLPGWSLGILATLGAIAALSLLTVLVADIVYVWRIAVTILPRKESAT
jgi:hypothetical protein